VDGKIKIGENNPNGFSAAVSMPADNAVLDAGGNRQAISKIELVQFDGNKQAIAAKMPNLIPNFTDKISYMNVVEDIDFFPIGYAQMNVNGRQEQMNFEKGANVSFNLERGTVDPLSNNILNAGDAMQVYQWDAVNANWKFND
jgi:hypothetical protein